jgi:hypothetical protein
MLAYQEEWCRTSMRTAARAAASSTAQLVSGARAGVGADACARAAPDLAYALRDLTAGVRASAALHTQPPRRERCVFSPHARCIANFDILHYFTLRMKVLHKKKCKIFHHH